MAERRTLNVRDLLGLIAFIGGMAIFVLLVLMPAPATVFELDLALRRAPGAALLLRIGVLVGAFLFWLLR